MSSNPTLDLIETGGILLRPFLYDRGNYSYFLGEYDVWGRTSGSPSAKVAGLLVSALNGSWEKHIGISVMVEPKRYFTISETDPPSIPRGRFVSIDDSEAQAVAQWLHDDRGYCNGFTAASGQWLFWKKCVTKQEYERRIQSDLDRLQSRRKVEQTFQAIARARRSEMRWVDGDWYHEDEL